MTLDKDDVKEAVKAYLVSRESKDERKEVFKQAITEYLNAQFAEVGKWSLRGLLVMLVVGILYLFAKAKGIL